MGACCQGGLPEAKIPSAILSQTHQGSLILSQATSPSRSLSAGSKRNPQVPWSASHPPPHPRPTISSEQGHPVGSTVTPCNPGLQTRARDHCLVRKVSVWVSGFLLSPSVHHRPPHPASGTSPSSLLPGLVQPAARRASWGRGGWPALHPRDTETESWGFPKQQP